MPITVLSEGEGAPRPWEQPGAVRRDCSPHRGTLLLRLACAAWGCGLASVLVAPAVPGLALAAAVWGLARQDLTAMAAGRMDPAGYGLTRQARNTAVEGTVITGAVLLFYALLFVLILIGP